MWSIQLLDSEQGPPIHSVSLPAGTHDIGREVLNIADKRLSRKQVSLTLPSDPNGSVMLKAPKHPIRVVRPAPAPAPTPTPAPAAPVPVAAAAADAVPAGQPGGPAAAPAADAVPAGQPGGPSWQVKLGGSFKAYEERSVHEALEAALAGFEDTAEVLVRGTAYIVHLKATPMKQVQKADPTKWRQVRRVGPPAAAPAPAAASALASAPAPAPSAVTASPAAAVPESKRQRIEPAATPPPAAPPPAMPPPAAPTPPAANQFASFFDDDDDAAAAAPESKRQRIEPAAAPPPAAPPPAAPPPAAPPPAAPPPAAPPPAAPTPPAANQFASFFDDDDDDDAAPVPPRAPAQAAPAQAPAPPLSSGAVSGLKKKSLADLLMMDDDLVVAPPPAPPAPVASSAPAHTAPVAATPQDAPSFAPSTTLSQMPTQNSFFDDDEGDDMDVAPPAAAAPAAAPAPAPAPSLAPPVPPTAPALASMPEPAPVVASPPAPAPSPAPAPAPATVPAHVHAPASAPAPAPAPAPAAAPDAPPWTLAFPPLGLGPFAFEVDKAAATAMSAIAAFLRERPEPQLRLLLVLDEPARQQQPFERARAAEPGLLASPRLEILSGGASLVALRSGARPTTAACVANPANHRLNAKGGGLNRELHAAAPGLEAATRAAFGGGFAAAGRAVAVALAADCPLRTGQGVEWIIHAVAPNMNPNKPECLNGDYEAGCRLLAETYRNLFHEFVSRAAP